MREPTRDENHTGVCRERSNWARNLIGEWIEDSK